MGLNVMLQVLRRFLDDDRGATAIQYRADRARNRGGHYRDGPNSRDAARYDVLEHFDFAQVAARGRAGQADKDQ